MGEAEVSATQIAVGTFVASELGNSIRSKVARFMYTGCTSFSVESAFDPQARALHSEGSDAPGIVLTQTLETIAAEDRLRCFHS